MDITIVTTAHDDDEGRALLLALGFPLGGRARRSAGWGGRGMAKKALRNKQRSKPKFRVREYTRCQRCGRPRAVFKQFLLCRICFRELAHLGELPGVTKASW